MPTPFRLGGKRALVTGGASGIGEAITRVFTEAGASVYIADINKAQSEALAGLLAGASAVTCDITDEASFGRRSARSTVWTS
jgi:NAD(P)-dependent dehydrogenase (short-subunit alcohol dehydrogenase family)